jgi:cold shock CspA family protein
VKGKIKKYLSYRGYGFIEYEGSEKDIFFHSSNFQSTEIPGEGREVEFRVIDTPKGKEAVDVKVVPSGVEEVSEESEEVEEVPDEVEEVPDAGADLGELSGVGPKYLELLKAAGVESVESMTGYAPEVLLANLLAVNEAQGITKRPPTLPLVKEWIEAASELG